MCFLCGVVLVQIPSDLISFDPANSALGAGASVTEKLAAVKGHVKQIEGMVRLRLHAVTTPLQCTNWSVDVLSSIALVPFASWTT